MPSSMRTRHRHLPSSIMNSRLVVGPSVVHVCAFASTANWHAVSIRLADAQSGQCTAFVTYVRIHPHIQQSKHSKSSVFCFHICSQRVYLDHEPDWVHMMSLFSNPKKPNNVTWCEDGLCAGSRGLWYSVLGGAIHETTAAWWPSKC